MDEVAKVVVVVAEPTQRAETQAVVVEDRRVR